MKNLTQWKIVDWANNDVDTGGETFDSFEMAWAWIHAFVPEDDHAYDDLFAVPVDGAE